MSQLPRFFKDAAGYCYPATPLLAQRDDMQPWDGAVDAHGFAVETASVTQPAEPRRRRTSGLKVPAAPQPE